LQTTVRREQFRQRYNVKNNNHSSYTLLNAEYSSNNTIISTVTGGITGTLSSVYDALSKPILELSQNNYIIANAHQVY
jgi:hypothetical protein